MANFQYKKVLLLGSTSGIGAALADKLVENGVFVIGVGRREDRLKAFVSKHGQQKADYRVLDINDLKAVSFSTDLMVLLRLTVNLRDHILSLKCSERIQTLTSCS